MSQNFAEILATLPAVDHLAGIELIWPDEVRVVIENKLGSLGSLRIYQYLQAKFGAIDAVAAAEGLRLYAEHSEDARCNPGKHPNIDRLLAIVAGASSVRARLLLTAP
jgi:hypothetical protein